MNPLTALCFLLSAFSLYLLRPVAYPGAFLRIGSRTARRLGVCVGALVAGLEGMTLERLRAAVAQLSAPIVLFLGPFQDEAG